MQEMFDLLLLDSLMTFKKSVSLPLNVLLNAHIVTFGYGFPSESSFPAFQGVRRVVLDVKQSIGEVMEGKVSSLYLQIPRAALSLGG